MTALRPAAREWENGQLPQPPSHQPPRNFQNHVWLRGATTSDNLFFPRKYCNNKLQSFWPPTNLGWLWSLQHWCV